MARIAGIDLPRDKRIVIGLTYIYGIGGPTAEKLVAEADSTVTFDKVVALTKDDNSFVAGAPLVKGATVSAKVLKNGKSKKITVFTYKPKKDSKRKMGHRQPYTQVRIEAINA